MNENLKPEHIVGIALYDYIVNNGISEKVLENMHTINILESVGYNTNEFNTTIEEMYTRDLYLNSGHICRFTKVHTYTDEEKPSVKLNVEQNATLDDLREFLIYSDYSDLLVIAEEIEKIISKKESPILKLSM